MNKFDCVVIGGGLAGLVGACVAAQRGAKVALLAFGAGALSIGCGTIDVLGYDGAAKPLKSSRQGLFALESTHPYAKIGVEAVEESLEWLRVMTARHGFPYVGDLETMLWIPTAAGTLKPTCLVPPTVDAAAFREARRVLVVGFAGLKDFCAAMVEKNLAAICGERKEIFAATLQCELAVGRDPGVLDMARWLETPEGERSFVEQLKERVSPDTVVVLPPVLGTRPECALIKRLQASLGCGFIEAACLPPAVTGLRLESLLCELAAELGVTLIENAKVTAAVVEDGFCRSVSTEHPDRTRTYQAESYLFATGGLYGGGLESGPGGVVEPIFGLSVDAPAVHGDWTEAAFLAVQPFARLGIRVNALLQPVDARGNVVLKNVRIAGRSLGGYDFCVEHSGNGVALASAYKAAILAREVTI